MLDVILPMLLAAALVVGLVKLFLWADPARHKHEALPRRQVRRIRKAYEELTEDLKKKPHD